ncbi:MAG: GGDEF domain-containing protein [Clostridia bacterium]|nr:GGDEF domain-containing protein [Clostridia bacterium]
MKNDFGFIEEIYFGLQIVIMVFLLNVGFPLFGSGGSIQMKIMSLLYAAFITFRFYRSYILSSTEGKCVDDSYSMIIGLIEGAFLFAFVVINISMTTVLSNLVVAYVMVQSIRISGRKRYYFVLLAVVIDAYIFLQIGLIDALIPMVSNIVLIIFITLCIGTVFKEVFKLQMQNDYYMTELMESNHKLNQLANTDYLTGLHNHKYFYLTLNNFKKYCDEKAESLCMALIDIDNFKKVNDIYGHLAGDAVLVKLAQLMQSNVRKGDFIARYGGEEFVIIFPQVKLREAERICENLRRVVESSSFEVENHQLRITVSTGLSQLEFMDLEVMQDFIKKVDNLLYMAKNGGKNCVVSQIYKREVIS